MRRSEIIKQINVLDNQRKLLSEAWRTGEVQTLEDCRSGDMCYVLSAENGSITINKVYFNPFRSLDQALLGMCFLTEEEAITRRDELLTKVK